MWKEAAISLKKASRADDAPNLYQVLEESTGKKETVSEVVKDNQGKNISSQNDRMSRWRQNFQSFLNPSNSSPSDDLPPSVEKKPYDVELGRPTRAEILTTIKTLKNLN